MSRLCVVALNPSIDAEWRVDDVRWEEKNVVTSERRWAGGKGVNVARWLKFLRSDAELLILLGGATGREMRRLLSSEHIPNRLVPLREATRVNIVVTTNAGRQMRFNPSGPKVNPAEWRHVLAQAKRMVRRGATLVLSGSLPRGIPASAYAQLIALAHQSMRRVLVDCDGPALVAALHARPFLVKPNLHELSLWAGERLRGVGGIRDAALRMSQRTQGWVLVSLGERGGMLVHAENGFVARATAPRVLTVNTVGAGDALLAAVADAIEQDLAPEDWLRNGVASGTAATAVAAGRLPGRRSIADLRRVVMVTRVRFPGEKLCRK